MRDDGHETATKADLRDLATKSEFGTLQTEFGTLRGEFRSFREEMLSEFKSFRADIRDMIRPITITLANHTAELADIRGHIKDKMVTREEFHSRMDGFTGRVDDHEKRISSLEEKPA